MSILMFYITCQFIPTQTWDWGLALGNFLNLQEIFCDNLISVYWSLSSEWWFYIILAFIGLSLLAKRTSIRIISFVALCFSISLYFIGQMSPNYLVIWFMGALAYLTRPTQKNKWVLMASFLGIIISIVLWQMSSESNSVQITWKIENKAIINMLLSLSVCLFIQQIILYEPKSRVMRFVETKLGYMGNFSYTLYLSHRIVLMWIFYYLFDMYEGQMTTIGIIIFSLIVACCVFTCWLFYFVSERYTPQLKKVLKSHLLD